MHYDIAIIGYGPVGAITANLFAQKGFNIVVVEPKKDIWNIQEQYILMDKLKEYFNLWALWMKYQKLFIPWKG